MYSNEIPRFCKFIRSSLPEWKELEDSDIDFLLLNSITNRVYKITAKKDGITPQTAILRNFCGKEGIVDKDKEIKVFAEMSKTGFGPQCLAAASDLRIEEYIPSRIIGVKEYKERIMRRKLARTMAAIHTLDVPGVEKIGLFDEILRDPQYYKMFDEKCAQDIYDEDEKPLIRELKTASSVEERDFIKSILPKDELIFAHNDLLQGNILISNDKEDVIFIDYEYASYNFIGYDIGNMFKEATFNYQVSTAPYFKIEDENFPNDEELRDFLRYYLLFSKMPISEQNELGNSIVEKDELLQTYLDKYFSPEGLKEREDELVRETKIGVMLSHYYWLVWAVKMHKTANVQFQYLQFAYAKFKRYSALKKELTH